jgi:hypothetical protein
MATQTNETLSNIGEKVSDKVSDTSAAIAQKASQASSKLSNKIDDVAHKLRDSVPEDGRFGSAASTVATGLERTGQYLRDNDLRSLGGDLQGVVRRYPVQASLVGLGLGILLGRALINRSSARV